jgi:hypothetical protein
MIGILEDVDPSAGVYDPVGIDMITVAGYI